MNWETETPFCLTLNKPCPHIRQARGYTDTNKSRYFVVSTIIERTPGLWEPTLWMTNNHGPKDYHNKAINYLLDNLGRVSGTFETNRLKAYKRMFRENFQLIPLKIYNVVRNGVDCEFVFVEFKHLDKKEF